MPKIIDHDKRRQDIIDVATQIILKGGFEAATMRSIAAEAGFANGALKHYFSGKESIIAATFENVLQGLEAVIPPEDAAGDPRERLYEFLKAPIPQNEEQIAAGRVLLALWEHAMSDDGLAELYRQHLTRWRRNLQERLQHAFDAGAITMPPPYDVVAREYMTVTIGAMVVNLMYPRGDRIPDYIEYVDAFNARLG